MSSWTSPRSSSDRSTCSSTTPGIMPIGPFLAEDDATAQRILDINVHGVILGMKLALPRMLARGSGHIVNIASQAGKYGFPGGATYCASKAAVINLSRAVRKEVRGSGHRDIGDQPGRGQHRTGPRPVRAAPAPVQEDRAPAGRRCDRRDAARAALRRARSQAARDLRARGGAVADLRAGRPLAREQGRRGALAGRRRRARRLRAARRPLGARAAAGARAGRRSPGSTEQSSSSALEQPVGDQPADQRALVLLQEVARVRDRTRRPSGRSRSAKASPTDSGRIGIGVGPQHQRRAVVLAQRVEHALSLGRARRLGRLRDQQREGARAGLRGGVGVGRVVGARSPRRPDRV